MHIYEHDCKRGLDKGCLLNSCLYCDTNHCGWDCCKLDHFYPLQKGRTGCFQQWWVWPWHEAGSRTLHWCLIDQAVFSLGVTAGVVHPTAEQPVCAVVQREAPGGVAAVALLPLDDCQGKLLRKRENRSVRKCHGINSLRGMLLLYKEK